MSSRRTIVNAYIELTKPRILIMQLVTVSVGYFLGRINVLASPSLYVITLIGTGFIAAGASTLNHVMEKEPDAKMDRTLNRPLPKGVISVTSATLFGCAMAVMGVAILFLKVNILTGIVGLSTLLLYNFVYTPLKQKTWLNTFVGAIPGALPPLGGFAAASGVVTVEAWVLFSILYIWQLPHFYAIAWIYKEDYQKAGFQMLPIIDPDGIRTVRQILFFSIVLLVISMVPVWLKSLGMVYGMGTLGIGIGSIYVAIKLFQTKSLEHARLVFRVSIIYLPLWLFFILLDRVL
ncbi:MAG: protoheme IX farnesyltransferase [Candidatus Margulisbacteria bacterium]|nr:protoheme IX farnesyltransferase [Candidatus Margulisiibacteriota bacterium]